MGDTEASRLTQLRDAVRERIGKHAERLTHTCDVIVDEACRFWPEKEFLRIAAEVEANRSDGRDAIAVISTLVAKCRENIEARWGNQHTQGINLLLEPVVIQLANIWFSSPQARLAMRQVILRLRQATKRRPPPKK